MKKITRNNALSRLLKAMRDSPDISDPHNMWVEIQVLLCEYKDMRFKDLKRRFPKAFTDMA